MLEAQNLSKHYNGMVALDSLNLKIERGEIFCLLGANGAGKTTTINLFLNFIPPTSGTAKINQLDVVQHPLETKKFLPYIPEQVMLYRNLTGIENLEYFTSLAGERYTRDQLLGFLKEAGLPPRAAEKRVGAYSKGMRQKVGIAIAIAKKAKAKALLLDEPTSGLDPKAANEFSELMKKMRDSGSAILVATHDLFRAKESGTRVGIMKHGRMVATPSHRRDWARRSRTHLSRAHARLKGILMIATVARKEMKDLIRDGRFRWAGGIVLALLAGSLALGWQHYREVNAQHELARRATREQWLHQGVKNPLGGAA
jgi:ABC-2 type transport system ATP-binding protein